MGIVVRPGKRTKPLEVSNKICGTLAPPDKEEANTRLEFIVFPEVGLL